MQIFQQPDHNVAPAQSLYNVSAMNNMPILLSDDDAMFRRGRLVLLCEARPASRFREAARMLSAMNFQL